MFPIPMLISRVNLFSLLLMKSVRCRVESYYTDRLFVMLVVTTVLVVTKVSVVGDHSVAGDHSGGSCDIFRTPQREFQR